MELSDNSSKPKPSLEAVGRMSTHDEGVVLKAQPGGLPVSTPKKNMSIFVVICLGWNICNSWAGVAVTMSVSLPSGGVVTAIYGIILVTLAYICCVCTLAELASVYPTAGGQYHWTSILAPKKLSRGLSYVCGTVNTFSWISITAGVTLLCPQYILSICIYWHPDYEPKTWHYFMVYQASNIFILLYNIYGIRRVGIVYDVAFVASLSLFFVATVVCLARSSPKQSSEFVWATFLNETGWKNTGIVFLTGMINPNYMFGGIDGAIHVAEEALDAARTVPYALFSTLIIGFVSAFTFVIAMAYSITSWDQVISTPTGLPIYEIWMQASKSEIAGTLFVATLIGVNYVVLLACQHTASRLTWAFARDNALIFSPKMSHINEKLEVPVWSLLANSFVIFILGFVYLASSTAFNAFIGTGLILQHITFAIPAILLLIQHRSSKYLKPNRFIKLGPFGWVANGVTVVWGMLTLVVYCFPAYLPVTGGSMNYSVVVLAAMAIFGGINWLVHANKKYEGPRLEE